MRMAPKGRFGRVGAGHAGREGDFAIALRTPDIARAAAGRRRRGEFARLASAHGPADRGAPRLSLTPLNLVLAAFALAGCAAVGPNFERPAAIVSPQFKEIKGWKIATPRESEPKGAWWSVFDDPELDRLDTGRGRVQPDGQGGRSQLSRGAGPHQRGPGWALSHCRGNWFCDAQFAQRHDPDRGSLGNVDARHLGPGPAGDRGAAGGRAN